MQYIHKERIVIPKVLGTLIYPYDNWEALNASLSTPSRCKLIVLYRQEPFALPRE